MINKTDTLDLFTRGVSMMQSIIETHIWTLRFTTSVMMFLLSTVTVVTTMITSTITFEHINFFILMGSLSIALFGYRNLIFLFTNPIKALKFWVLTLETKEHTDPTTGNQVTCIAHPLGWKRKIN